MFNLKTKECFKPTLKTEPHETALLTQRRHILGGIHLYQHNEISKVFNAGSLLNVADGDIISIIVCVFFVAL